ncbi:phenylalanine--tRNA ligase subunit beta [Candidatus Photodesmus anomalopis]|uniref:Phenylalanine--tRNA ligase beta subunit n=1 Tax=Candidatus Photodesmus katoptron Akat1 TaxID=1236703 RepID=S3DGN2_9GAMM|nr:phenylalanine--tRNA ligase subunit beta [Candidatus Photodesmus katoptron]EPE37622.1 phenylalanyl-tRNA synthetase beta chain, PheRS [Candidatus Photodesmus katoptron Akat1]
MKFSKSWLCEWVNFSNSASELAKRITMAGLEVDNIYSISRRFTGVKIGYILQCYTHPNTEKLKITQVNVGTGELLNIVCSASNCRAGIKIPVAIVGSVLPCNVKIRQIKVCGQISNGMLCSFSDLGININNENENSIIELEEEAQVGTDFYTFLNFHDVIFDLNLTPNRGDCFSIRGIAREIAALTQTKIMEPDFKIVKPNIKDTIPIELQVPEVCPRYFSRIIKNINIKAKTPFWIREKLRRCGMQSTNLVLDINNYVLLEQGQPIQAFDLSKIVGRIIIRNANKNDRFKSADGNDIMLNIDTVVVADEDKILSIAGILGSQSSSVNTHTKSILLESAFFSPDYISGHARHYGILTDASSRFERGVDYNLQLKAIERATQLLIDISGGDVSTVVSIESKCNYPKQKRIKFHRFKLDRILGYHIPDLDVLMILKHLGFLVKKEESDWLVTVPTWRFDITIEQDLVEEIARIYGYDNMPNQFPLLNIEVNNTKKRDQSVIKKIRSFLVSRGYHEAITYSFVKPEQQELFFPDIRPFILPYPISSDMSAMRLGLIQGLLNAVSYNQKRQQPYVRLFEYGRTFIPCKSSENNIQQELMLACVISGTRNLKHWSIPVQEVDFFDLKGDLESILELSNNNKAYKFKAEKHPAFHPGQSAAIFLEEEKVGIIGTIHPKLESELDLYGRTFAFEIRSSTIDTSIIPTFLEISKYPSNRRDISIIVDENITFDSIIRSCFELGGTFLKDAKLFDLYVGNGIKKGKKSLAIALMFQSTVCTLTEQDISKLVKKILIHISKKFGASLRD